MIYLYSPTQNSQKIQHLTEQGQTPIQENRSRPLWRNIHDQWMQTGTNQSICNNINARTKLQ